MNCPKCGALLDDDAKFCVICGERIDNMDSVNSEPSDDHCGERIDNMDSVNSELSDDQRPVKEHNLPQQELNKQSDEKKNFSNKSTSKIIGLAVGTILIIIGVVRIMTAGTSISPTSFGGDFYTYTYEGIVAVSEILASIEVSLGWVIVAIGAAIDVIALRD